MIYESYFQEENETYYMAHSELKPNVPTITFIHGLGDSGMSYRSYLNSDLKNSYNILIPDLLGYGKSSRAQDYSFEHQIQGIEKHIGFLQNNYQVKFSDLILVSHSMGGILATLLCSSHLKEFIKLFINVEGSVTQYGSFIAEKMVQALKVNSFSKWFESFKNNIYENLAQQNIPIRTYYASLEFCDPDAFLKSGLQMYQLATALPGKYTHLIGKKYSELNIPRVYCYGDSMCKETLMFLHEQKLDVHHVVCKNHFLLSESINEFVLLIDQYIKNTL